MIVIVALCLVAAAACCAATIIAAVKLYSIRSAFGKKQYWYDEPVARKWVRLSYLGYSGPIVLAIILLLTEQPGIAAGVGLTGVFALFILPATSEGEGAN